MREIDPQFQARLDSGATTLCRCWRVTRRDGVVLGFTDHDEDVTFDGIVHRAGSGLTATALQGANGLSVDNSQAVGALQDDAVSDADIRSGKYDGADILHWLVDWQQPELRVLMFNGSFGEIRRSDGVFEVELRGQTEQLNVPVGRTMLRTCDRVLGDRKCRFNLNRDGFWADGVVDARSSDETIVLDPLDTFEAGFFASGTLRWASGPNSGTTQSIKTDVAGGTQRTLVLWQRPAVPPSAGDAFRIFAGCDKRAETCRAKFGNFLNFRGFPHIPGEDWVTAYPRDGEVHDGRSQQR